LFQINDDIPQNAGATAIVANIPKGKNGINPNNPTAPRTHVAT
jgi:hypothetical protein